MKKLFILLSFIIIAGFTGRAQNYTLQVHGYVNAILNNGYLAVSGQQVIISIDSTGSGFTYYSEVYTNDNGYYVDNIEVPNSVQYGYVQAMTYDSCAGIYQVNGAFFGVGMTLPMLDFIICGTTNNCQAMFLYSNMPGDPYTYNFQNVSVGDFTSVSWDFGDSTYSTEMNPVHTFPGPGVYIVCLSISGNDCNSIDCEPVYAGGNGWGCENYFSWFPTDPSSFTIQFDGFMLNGQQALSYDWDFGDGSTGSGQSVTHTYDIGPNGNASFMVSLTTVVPDSMGATCTYTSWQQVWFFPPPDCYAYFYYFPDSTDMMTIHFQDMSYTANGNMPDNWFWDFGDGNTSTLQNPVHMYADSGIYFVCLTIGDSIGNCTNTYCEEVYTGIFPPPPFGCESYIIPYNQYGLTVEFEGWTMSQYPTEYTWEFGDGISATGQFVNHTYASPGIYNVSLFTIDTTGCSWMSTLEVWVDSTWNGGCSNYFYYDQTDSLTFTFMGQAYLNNGQFSEETTFDWDFGDGTSGTGQTVTHTFQQNPAGIYTVCLTTMTLLPDGDSCFATSCQDVWLVQPGFSIYGHVYLSNNTVADYALVHLMTMDTLWQNVVEVETVALDSGGFYSFGSVPMYNSRLYFVQAELTDASAYYGEYLPTYYVSALSWEQAMPILPLMNWPADIFMVPGTTLNNGNCTITGSVTNLGARSGMSGVEVVLMDEQMNPYYYVRSDEQGNFQFENLPYGTYIIHAEITGIHTNEASVTLSEGQPGATLEIQVSGGEANVVFGINEHSVAIEKVGDIYPNPVTANSRVEISMKEPMQVELSIINQLGQRVYTESTELSAGTQTITFGTENLDPGIYLLRIMTSNGDLVTRRFVKTR